MLEQWTGKLCLGYPSWIAGFNPRVPPTPTVSVNLYTIRSDSRATRRDTARRFDIDAKAETWSMSWRRWKKLRYARILLWQVINPMQCKVSDYLRAKTETAQVANMPSRVPHFRSVRQSVIIYCSFDCL